MAWWTENYHWILAGIGAAVLILLRRWALGRLFRGARMTPDERQEADLESRDLEPGQADAVIVTRPSAGVIGTTLLKLGLILLAGALVAAGLLYGAALLKGVPITALPTSLVLVLVGSVGALWVLIAGLYLLGRLAMGRRARQYGIRAGSVASGYEHILILAGDPAAALGAGRAALLALPQDAALERDGDRPDAVIGRTAKSARSFGEIIRIRVQGMTARRTAVEIRSRPASWQLFDGGINAENVSGIVRSLEAGAVGPAEQEPVADRTPAPADPPLTTADWLALAYLAALAGYTGTLIALKELWPDSFAIWTSWLEGVPLDPLRLLGQTCPAHYPIVSQLNMLILPTLLAYSAYNTLEFRSERERMDLLNGILCLGSLVFLPLLVLTGCSPDWAEGLTSKYRGLIRFLLEDSAGAVLYALLLVIFSNGASYLPALALARIFPTQSKP